MKNNENEIHEQNQGGFPAIQVGLYYKTTHSGTQNASFCNVEWPKLYDKTAETSHLKGITHPLLMHKPLTIKRKNAKETPSVNATFSWPTTYKTLHKTREFAELLTHFATRKIQSPFCKIYSEAKQRLRCCVLNLHYHFERENSYLFADSFTLSSRTKKADLPFFLTQCRFLTKTFPPFSSSLLIA